jgi:hypothetical protein
MLHMAIMNYKNEYGSFPPCSDPAFAAGGPASKHLMRIFPRCVNATASGADAQFAGASALTPFNAIVSWLGGFTDNPRLPLTGGPRKKLYDFDQSRLTGLQYHPPKKLGSPFIYIDAANYANFPYFTNLLPDPGAQRVPLNPPPTSSAADFGTVNPVPTTPPPQPFFNPDSFQILCAGSDEVFGTDDDLSNFWPGTRREYLDSLR